MVSDHEKAERMLGLYGTDYDAALVNMAFARETARHPLDYGNLKIAKDILLRQIKVDRALRSGFQNDVATVATVAGRMATFKDVTGIGSKQRRRTGADMGSEPADGGAGTGADAYAYGSQQGADAYGAAAQSARDAGASVVSGVRRRLSERDGGGVPDGESRGDQAGGDDGEPTGVVRAAWAGGSGADRAGNEGDGASGGAMLKPILVSFCEVFPWRFAWLIIAVAIWALTKALNGVVPDIVTSVSVLAFIVVLFYGVVDAFRNKGGMRLRAAALRFVAGLR